MTRLAWMLSLVCFALALGPQARAQGTADSSFYRAFYLENATRDPEAALEAYGKAAEAARAEGKKDLVAKSLAGKGRCLKVLGRTDEALAVFSSALEIDPANEEAKSAVESAPAGNEDVELAQRIRDLMAYLEGGYSKEVVEQLVLMGPAAVPRLERALHSRNVNLVTGAALVLAQIGTTDAIAALVKSLSDSDVLFPSPILAALRWLPERPESMDVFEAALALGEAKFRVQAVESLGKWSGRERPDALARLTPLVQRAYRDPAPEMRSVLVKSDWPSEAMRGVIRAGLASKDASERLQVIQWWAGTRPSVFTGELLGALKDASADVRLAALGSLSRYSKNDQRPNTGDEILRDACVTVLDDDDARVAGLAAKELLGMLFSGLDGLSDLARTPSVLAAATRAIRHAFFQKTSEDQWRQLTSLFRSLAYQIEPAVLMDLLSASVSIESRFSSDARSRFRREQLFERLLRQAQQGDDPTLFGQVFEVVADPREKAIWLQQRGDGKDSRPHQERVLSPDVYVSAASSAEPEVRLAAYGGILDAKVTSAPRSAFPFLGADLLSEGEDLRNTALLMARAFPDPAFTPSLRTLHERATGQTRAEVLEALVACAGKDALPEVRADLGSVDSEAFPTALRRLVELLGDAALDDVVKIENERGPSGTSPLSILGQWYDTLPFSSDALARYVEKIPPQRVSTLLLIAVANGLREDSRSELILSVLKSGRRDAQPLAVEMAGRYNVVTAVPALLALLESSDETVRSYAKVSLESIRSFKELKASFEAQGGDAGRSEALAKAKTLLSSANAEQRRGAALALGALGEAGAIPSLLDLLSDSDATVRAAALQALERLGGAPKVSSPPVK